MLVAKYIERRFFLYVLIPVLLGCLLLDGLLSDRAHAMNSTCHPVLWPMSSQLIRNTRQVPQSTSQELQIVADQFLNKNTHPMIQLGSAGQTTIHDPQLIASREAFKDADRAAVLALAYYLTKRADDLHQTRNILISWAKINRPTGNPIDETRLEGMIWAYDLIACSLSSADKTLILQWFDQMRMKKRAWSFSHTTSSNNHRIHQIKMLLLLDKLLGRQEDATLALKDAEYYSTINLNPKTGESLDYRQRSALYYHNYVMQPWLEIALTSNCCHQQVTKGFTFLSQHILSHHIHREFRHSTAKIDALRASGGFDYAKKNGTFDVTKATPAIITYYTITNTSPNAQLWSIVQNTKPSPWLTFLQVRKNLWRPQSPSSAPILGQE